MTNVHTSIGALELGDSALSFDDAMLEQSGKVAMSPMPTSPLVPPCGRHIDDATLEQAMTAGPTPTSPFSPMCHHIDDGALEQAGAVTAGPPPTRGFNPLFPQCH
jgi:hypothetical protein